MNGGLWASDVAWGADGRFLYAAARLHNSLSVFALDATSARLSLVQRIACGGATPRCLCLAPDGSLLLVCNMHGHNVCSFAIDAATGELRAVDVATVPLASCLKMHAA